MGKAAASTESSTLSSSRREEEVEQFSSLKSFGKTVEGTTVTLYFSSLPSKQQQKEIYLCRLVFFSVKKTHINCVKETPLQTL